MSDKACNMPIFCGPRCVIYYNLLTKFLSKICYFNHIIPPCSIIPTFYFAKCRRVIRNPPINGSPLVTLFKRKVILSQSQFITKFNKFLLDRFAYRNALIFPINICFIFFLTCSINSIFARRFLRLSQPS